jgi:hypothetical protein
MDWDKSLEEKIRFSQIMAYMKAAYGASFPNIQACIYHYETLNVRDRRTLLRETNRWYKTYGIS